jgi:hypothetical protein
MNVRSRNSFKKESTMSKWYLLLDGLNVQVVQLTDRFVEDFSRLLFMLIGPFDNREEARRAVHNAEQAQAAGWMEGYKAGIRKDEVEERHHEDEASGRFCPQ